MQEALAFLSAYNLVEQEKAQIFIADASGDYAIVHANYVIKKDGNNFTLTNYCINDNEQHVCWRRSIVTDMLKQKTEFGLSDIQTMMSKAAQSLTNPLPYPSVSQWLNIIKCVKNTYFLHI